MQVTVYLFGRIIPAFSRGGGGGGDGGQVTCSGEKLLRLWVTTPRIRKKYVFYFLSKFLIGQVFSQSNPFTQHSRIFYEMKFIYL